MWIEVKKLCTNKITKDCTLNRKNIYSFAWEGIVPDDYSLISEKLFFNLDIDIDYKKNKIDNKIILIGQYDDKFWFFKIIKDTVKDSYYFSAKKPLLDNIHNLKISILDWYNIITRIEPEKLEIEYAVSRNR